jgi:hypothetical protein
MNPNQLPKRDETGNRGRELAYAAASANSAVQRLYSLTLSRSLKKGTVAITQVEVC